MTNNYYNYIYLDPRKPGRYSYNGLNFSLLYEPFYVGKGTRYRFSDHLKPSSLKSKSYKNHKIKAILKENYKMHDFIICFNRNITNKESLNNEITIIQIIGRYDLKTGPLCNKTGGGEGIGGRTPARVAHMKILHEAAQKANKGCKRSEEACQRMAQAQSGAKKSPETKAKMAAAKLGKSRGPYNVKKKSHRDSPQPINDLFVAE